MQHVFLSYRRDDTAGEARRIYETLAHHPRRISRRRRPDYVLDEIRGALDLRVPVVPILVAGATMPATDAWPLDLRCMARRHAVEVRESSWDADVNEVVRKLNEALSTGGILVSDAPDQGYDAVASGRRTLVLPESAVDLRSAAHELAVWFRGRHLLAQVVHRPGCTVVETTDPRTARRITGLHGAYAVHFRPDGGSVEVTICKTTWTDLSPAAVHRRRQHGVRQDGLTKAIVLVPEVVFRGVKLANDLKLFRNTLPQPRISLGLVWTVAYLNGERQAHHEERVLAQVRRIVDRQRGDRPGLGAGKGTRMQPENITKDEYESELNRLHERREELEEQETTLTGHDHGGGLPGADQNRLDKVRGELADVLQEIGDLKDRYADAGGAPADPDGALGE